MNKIETYKDQAFSWLHVQFRRSNNVLKLLKVAVEQLDETEHALQAMAETRTIRGSTGQALDQWGALLGLSRDGLPDDQYRLLLVVQMAINASNGTPEDLIFIARQITNAKKVKVLLYEMLVSFELHDPDYPTSMETAIYSAIKRALVGGDSLGWITTVDSTSFRFDIGPGFDVGTFGSSI